MSLALGHRPSSTWSHQSPELMAVEHVVGGDGIVEPVKDPGDVGDRDRIVNLNVGGEMFSTRLGTLLDARGTYFAHAFSGNFLIEDAHFIDRDPRLFRLVLHYLRTRILMIPEGPEYLYLYRSLLEEARYFGINSMSDNLSKIISKYESCIRLATIAENARVDDISSDFSPNPIISRERIIPTDPIRFDDFDF